ncbi:MAG: hypothetical protein JWP64_4864 [Pseudonocardia sp.]|jgi:hypothetical protein|uniref:hypothetical protein n=1 Tax=Pseudonocardia sp. TaxID=60912 RepID=UPI00262FCA5D|nr:hypothetical protein [Pseudonocardia sp.]MCU1629915.1 hypothetical protein [Pseudonocardia sp.]
MDDWVNHALTVDVTAAAAAARDAATLEAGRQADRLVGPPLRPGSPEWEAEEGTELPALRERAWQLVQLRMDLAAGLDPIGNLIALRRGGATWELIGKAAGVSRQSAHERWSARVTEVLDRYGTGEKAGPIADDEACLPA